ncbi:pentapeptide repeat-containing protein [Streptomyces sp. NBC_01261]|uniref:pentapeptide repeat-containing protein n=1 Tax=Streptomyces sp. NBC_01261 TaxID=2903802 RepID=UPI002E32CA73|nr:pentapeptide repeat-containing protein [Streptomyces sp. NBC_01261]
MNHALAADYIQRHLPALGLAFAALVLVGVLLSILKDSGATTPDDDDQRSKPTRWQVFRAGLGGLAGATIFVLLFWQGPWWFDSLHIRKTKLGPADGVVITGFRTGLVALAAGLIAGAGLYYTHKKHQLEQRQFKHAQKQFTESLKQFETTVIEAQRRDARQADLTREGQVTGRYVEAIKLLASEGIHEKLGGIYSLERIMNDSERDRNTIVEVLAAFVRQRLNGDASEIRQVREQAEIWAIAEEHGESIDPEEPSIPHIPLAEDIRAALSVLSRNWTEGSPGSDLRSLNLYHWDASEAQLRGAYMFQVSLNGVQLNGASLEKAQLRDGQLYGTNLQAANLTDTVLVEATLSYSNLDGAQLVRTQFREAHLEFSKAPRANFTGADLTAAYLQESLLVGATFEGATFTGARLRDANLEKADLSTSTGLTVEQICRARIYSDTKLPAGIADHPWVKDRIAVCDAARANRKHPREWEKPAEPGPQTAT